MTAIQGLWGNRIQHVSAYVSCPALQHLLFPKLLLKLKIDETARNTVTGVHGTRRAAAAAEVTPQSCSAC